MGKPWFHVKKYGFGAGLPCSWEGWVALAIFVATMVGLSFLPSTLTQAAPWLAASLHGGAIFGIVVLAWAKSDGPWLWRWGGK